MSFVDSNTLLQVMDAEKQKTVSEAEHLRRADAFQVRITFTLSVFHFYVLKQSKIFTLIREFG